MQFHGASQRCSSTVRHNGDVLRCDPTPHLRQHFNPISSPESAAQHAWATLPRLSVARKHSGRPSREQNAPSRSRDDLGRHSREQNAPSRSRDNLGRPFREQNAPSRSRDILGRPFREQIALFRSRGNLDRPFREQNTPSRSRDDLGRLFREQNAPSRSRDNLGAVVRYGDSTGTLRGLYGDSTGTLRALLDAAEVRPEPVRLIERLGAFRDGDLDG